jgi:phospholipid/cholesterol/gamma-HCH transport system substrate-binding protein
MKDSKVELQVGVALVAALVLLVVGLTWFQDHAIGSNDRFAMANFPTVGGLGVGDPVRVRGISRGKVTAIVLTQNAVQVTMRIKAAVSLRDDAQFVLASAGIMGERMIAVEPGRGTEIGENGHVFEGRYELGLSEMMGQFEVFNDRVLKVLSRADSVLAQMQDDQLLRETLQSTKAAAETATSVLKENREDLRQTSASVASLAARFDRFLDEHEDQLGQGVEGLASNAAKLDTLLTEFGTVVASTQTILTALEEEQGVAGKLIFDEELGKTVGESVEQLRFLIEDLFVNPQRYLTIKIF